MTQIKATADERAMRCFTYSPVPRIGDPGETVNAGLIGDSYAWAVEGAADSMRKPMDAQTIAVDAVVALTDCDRDTVAAFIRGLYLAGVKDPKRLTFKGLQAMARA
jgi:hypothetical protein